MFKSWLLPLYVKFLSFLPYFSTEDLAKNLTIEQRKRSLLFQRVVSGRALISPPSQDTSRMTPGLEMKYFISYEMGKVATSKWSGAKQFTEVGFESWKEPKGPHKSDCPQLASPESAAAWGPGRLHPGSRSPPTPDPALPCNSTPLPDQPKLLKGEPKSGSEIKQSHQFSSLLPNSINFKSGTCHVKVQGQTRKGGKGDKNKKNLISVLKELGICSKR